MNERIIEARNETIKTYLGINQYKLIIPYSQRPYEWDTKQVERLLNDLFALYDHRDNEVHMLNFITLYNVENHYEIYDGQQRTLTLLLLIAVIGQVLWKFGNEQDATSLYGDYISKKGFNDPEPTPKIEFNIGDKKDNRIIAETFSQITKTEFSIADLNSLEKNDYTRSLIDNYKFISKEVNLYIEENELSTNDIKQLMTEILERTQVVIVNTTEPKVALDMFESLNNTGKSLDGYYVLKNVMISELDEDVTRTYWSQIDSNLDGYNKNEFMKSFKNLIDKKSGDNSNIQPFKDRFKPGDQESVKKLLSELVDASKFFMFIKNPNQMGNEYEKKDVTKFIENLKPIRDIFKFKQAYSIIIAMFMKGFPLEQINIVLEQIISILVLRQFILKDLPAEIGNPLIDIAYNIFNGKIVDSTTTITRIKEKRPSNQKIIDTVKGKEWDITKQSSDKIKFVLAKIYEKDLDGELMLNNGLREIDLEHILPQNPGIKSTWTNQFDEKEIKNYTFKLGNLTLLLSRINRGIKNGDFKDKKDKYLNSQIPENIKIAQNENWGKQQIDQRTKDLAEKIVNIW